MPAPGPTRSSISLEPGGKSARVVLEDVDLNLTIERTLVSAWTNSGQVCGMDPNDRAGRPADSSGVAVPGGFVDVRTEVVATPAGQYFGGSARGVRQFA